MDFDRQASTAGTNHDMALRPMLAACLASAPRVRDWISLTSSDEGGSSWLLHSGKIEFGQGIHAALCQIAAAALSVDVAQVRCAAVSTCDSPDEGTTSGSRSVEDSGALIAAACRTLKRSVLARLGRHRSVCFGAGAPFVRDGMVFNADARAMGRLIDLVGDDDLFETVATEFVDTVFEGEWIGRSIPRTTLPQRLFGVATFVHDLILPDMVHARVLRGSHHCSTPANAAALQRLLPAGVHWFEDGHFIALWSDDEDLLTRSWRRCRDQADWISTRGTLGRSGPLADLNPNDSAWLTQAPAETSVLIDSGGDHPTAGTIHAAVYTRPYLAHASIGPSCALARGDDGRLEVWTHSQGIHALRRELSNALALPLEKLAVHHREGAGCYGHNAADDVAFDAALLALRLGRAVRVQWMREDEFSCAPLGPATVIRLEAALDRQRITHWHFDAWGAGHHCRPAGTGEPRLLGAWQIAEPFQETMPMNMPLAAGGGAERNALALYAFEAQRVAVHRVLEPPVRSSSLRSLGALANIFAIESFVDELALAAGGDPVDFRIAHLDDKRAADVLRDAIERSPWVDWRFAPPADYGIGCALARYKGNGGYCAVVACVSVTQLLRVHDLYVSVDLGTVVNPDGVANQIEGGAIQASSWALKEAVQFDARGVASTSWESYSILDFTEVPRVHVHALDRCGLPALGAGEVAQGPTVAAIANALHHALGVRVRDLPLTFDRIAQAIHA